MANDARATDSGLTQQTARVEGAGMVRIDACKLVQTTGKDAGREVELNQPLVIVGSASDVDFRVRETTVSRQHFKIIRDPQTYRVEDLGSTNGTFVNGARVKEAYVTPGSVINAGDIHFELTPIFEQTEFPPSDRTAFGSVFGQSIRMREIFAVLEQVATTDATILMIGETGTGKSALARAIHDASERASGPFRVVDCGAITPTLVESELFGHERGAFTGAVKQRAGALELAEGGTLFIDELTDLALHLQPKLLRALEDREFTRVGGDKPIPFDCRVIAATQRELWQEVEEERFRGDLYFRLAVVTIQLPTLRERREDIPLLVDHFLATAPASKSEAFADLNADLQRKLMAHDWPGNIRELRNAVERIALMYGTDPFAHPGRRSASSTAAEVRGEAATFPASLDRPFKQAKEELLAKFEKAYVTRLLERVGGSVTEAAREAGLDRKHIYNLMSKHKLGD